MKKIESIIRFTLLTLLVWMSIEIVFSVFGRVEDSPTYIIPWRVNFTAIFLGIIFSGVFGILFPLWNVGRYLNTCNLREISNFSTSYKSNFFLMTMGFLALLLMSLGEVAPFIFGIVCLCLFYVAFISLLFIKKRPA